MKSKKKKKKKGGELIGFRGGKRKESLTIRSSGRDIESTLISKHLRALTSWKLSLSKTPPLSFTFAPDGTRVSRFERWFILRLSIDPREGDARDVLVEREVARVSESWIEKKKEEEERKKERRCNREGLRFRRFWNIFGTSFSPRSLARNFMDHNGNIWEISVFCAYSCLVPQSYGLEYAFWIFNVP